MSNALPPTDRQPFNQPLGGDVMPRFAGIATMMRLPFQATSEGLDACFVGVPFDLGTSNRSGARFGPRQIRSESVLLRPYNMATRAAISAIDAPSKPDSRKTCDAASRMASRLDSVLTRTG